MHPGLVKSFNVEEGVGCILGDSHSIEVNFKFVDGAVPKPDLHLPSMEPGELPVPKEGDRVVFLTDGRGSAFIWAFEDAYREACGN